MAKMVTILCGSSCVLLLIFVAYVARRSEPSPTTQPTQTVTRTETLNTPTSTATPTNSALHTVSKPVQHSADLQQEARSSVEPSPHIASNTPSLTEHTAGYKTARATVFWVGERGSDENGFIHNRASAWDENWEKHFGGYDDPSERCGYNPCTFTPKENPFYVALPYNDLDDEGYRKPNSLHVPWYDPELPYSTSILKNRWVEVRTPEATCYAQWQDVGPFEQDDFAYVFGDAQNPINIMGERAGIDLSPAIALCLKLDGLGTVTWRHIESEDVPDGPWRTTITTRL